MYELWSSLEQLAEALWGLLIAVIVLATPWLGLAAWIAFWLFAVNWVTLRETLLKGGWTGLVLIALAAILVWGMVAPPVGGSHFLLGLTLSNFVGKTVYVTTLVCIMLFCGSLQLAGFAPACCSYAGFQPAADEEHGHEHGHGEHGHDHAGHDHSGHGAPHGGGHH